jgi:hypothetical protein
MIEVIQLTEGNQEYVEMRCNGSIKGIKLPAIHREIEFTNYLGETTRLLVGEYLVITKAGFFRFFTAEQLNSVFNSLHWIK